MLDKIYKKPEIGEPEGAGKFLANKWYVDELYDNSYSKPLFGLAAFFKNVIEKSGIDAVVNGVGGCKLCRPANQVYAKWTGRKLYPIDGTEHGADDNCWFFMVIT
jgi:NADH:ubiquinone oxidoreductase subunit 5 (subunit L)/multisubunit Na+/H+ antiporter MnhA subunit